MVSSGIYFPARTLMPNYRGTFEGEIRRPGHFRGRGRSLQPCSRVNSRDASIPIHRCWSATALQPHSRMILRDVFVQHKHLRGRPQKRCRMNILEVFIPYHQPMLAAKTLQPCSVMNLSHVFITHKHLWVGHKNIAAMQQHNTFP